MKAVKLFIPGLLLSAVLFGGEIFAASTPQATQSSSGGGVTVKVALLDSPAAGDLRFQVALDTHSVNLDSYDLKANTVLRDESGKSYSPTAVENKGSGHHRQVTVVFAQIPKSVKRIELVIKDVAGVKERIFRWDAP